MLSITKMTKLYENVMVNNIFSYNDLINMGFRDDEIDVMLKNSILLKVADEYNFIDYDRLYAYGNYYFDHNNKEKAYECFKACYEINRYHIKTCLKLFLYAIENKKYDEALEYFHFINKTEDVIYQKDNNMYLHLLSLIIKLPEEYENKLKEITVNDTFVSEKDSRFKDITLENKSRSFAYHQRFFKALVNHQREEDETNFLKTHNLIFNALIKNALEIEQNNLQSIKQMIEKQDYIGILNLIKQISKVHKLNKYFNLLLLLTKRYLNIFYNGKVPRIIDIKIESFDDAIWANDYHKAMEYIVVRNYEKGQNIENDLSYLMLKDICDLIDKLNLQQSVIGKNPSYDEAVDFPYYGIPFTIICEIASLITQGKNYNSIAVAYGLNHEEQDILLLILARECYYQGLYNLGDNYLNQVMLKEEKTPRVNSILNQILVNRDSFYEEEGKYHFRLVLEK